MSYLSTQKALSSHNWSPGKNPESTSRAPRHSVEHFELGKHFINQNLKKFKKHKKRHTSKTKMT